MISRIGSVAFDGISAKNVDVQVNITKGLPSFNIVGLADKAVSESKERVRSAFYAMGLALPAQRITVNLSPADLSKEGSHFDLPIALAILGSLDILPREEIINYIALGEMALDGEIKSVNGVLAGSILASKEEKGLIFPFSQLQEMYIVKDRVELLPIRTLSDIINHFSGSNLINVNVDEIKLNAIEDDKNFIDLASIKGQETAKRAIEVTAGGGHNLLMLGPPGSGKSMLANALGGILPPLTKQEILDVSLIYSVAGELGGKSFISSRPYRKPHHSASMASIVGGGAKIKAGEITLAHNGILFLDEIPEFKESVINALRQPIEDGTIDISRVNSHVTYPAKFQLIGAMNPCKCGYFGDADRQCSKVPKCANEYQGKISGPILDRMDLIIEVPAISIKDLNSKQKGISSNEIRDKVLKAREIQRDRYYGYKDENNKNIYTNTDATTKILKELALISPEAKDLLERSAEKFKLSARAYFRLMKVARTCADLEGSKYINISHIAEAVSYRKINYYQKVIN